jgi:hypothetical protein
VTHLSLPATREHCHQSFVVGKVEISSELFGRSQILKVINKRVPNADRVDTGLLIDGDLKWE